MMKRRASLALVLTVPFLVGVPALADDDAQALKEGQAKFNTVCATCHTNEPNKNKIGPTLFGLVGRKSGSAAGFNYSEAMKNAEVTWSEETLDKYLADPKHFIPGNKMPYLAVKKPE